ncbi:MAG: 30S ribosomal protein S19 [Candidatus Aenigmarchaeota archaeon]|nr:30S ribosomal protein S19 [Candidatus Aenigmarchaeota archaeon]
MAKFTYKGKDDEAVDKLSLEEFSRLIKSRARRSLKRGFTSTQKKLLEDIRKSPNKFHKTHCREMVIIPELVGKKLGVYSGKEFVTVEIKDYMLGSRLGEFAMSRKQIKHSAPGFGATKSSKFVPLK